MKHDFLLKAIFKKHMVPARLSLFTVNAAVVGHCIGPDALGVLSLMSPIYLLFVVAGAWINIGAFTQTMIAVGENRPEWARSYSTLAVFWTLLVSLVGSGAVFLLWQPLLTLLAVPAALRDLAASYGEILAAGGICFAFIHYPFHFLKIAGLQRFNMALLLAMSAVDVALSLLFIYGFGMGLRGVAWATVLSMAFAGLWGFVILRRAHGRFLFGPVQAFYASSLAIFRSGSAVALGKVYDVVQIFALNRILFAAAGNDGLTVFAVVLSALNVCRVLFSLVIQPITPLAGLFYGQRDGRALTAVLRLSLQKGALFGLLPAAALLLFAEPAARGIGINGALLPSAAAALLGLAAALLPMAVNAVLIAYLLAVERALLANGLAFLRAVVLVGLYTAVAARVGDGAYIWANYAFAEWTALLLTLAYIGAGRLNLAAAPRGTAGALGETVFAVAGADPEQRWAESLERFCAANRLERHVGKQLRQFMAQSAPRVLAYCFPTEKKQALDVRVAAFSDRVVLRACCMGKILDPLAAGLGEAVAAELVCKRAMGFNQIFFTVARRPDEKTIRSSEA